MYCLIHLFQILFHKHIYLFIYLFIYLVLSELALCSRSTQSSQSSFLCSSYSHFFILSQLSLSVSHLLFLLIPEYFFWWLNFYLIFFFSHCILHGGDSTDIGYIGNINNTIKVLAETFCWLCITHNTSISR